MILKKAGDITNVKTGISNIKLDDINSEIEGVIKSYGGNDRTKGENFFDILNIGKKWSEMLNDLNRKTATTQKVANIQLKREQDRIKKETEEVQKRTQASIINSLMALTKGTIKLGESTMDFIISRNEQLEEEKLRQIYGAYEPSREIYEEYVEETIEQMRKETMAYVEKDHTETLMNKLYEESEYLQETDKDAYDLFKRTGAGYKVVEGFAPIAAATVVSVIAPEAAPVIVPTLIGINSSGGATEEFLHNKKSNSKEGITQSYENGEISKNQYDWYEFIWNMDDEEIERLAKSKNITKEEMEAIYRIKNMDEEWTTAENLTNANLYGDAVGAWDALQYAVGGNLFKFNPTTSAIVNSGIRVGIDTGFNAIDTPYRALVYSLIDKDTDFETAFENMGGTNAIKTNAIIGFGGSIFGELFDAARSKRTKTEIENNINIQRTKTEIDNDSIIEYGQRNKLKDPIYENIGENSALIDDYKTGRKKYAISDYEIKNKIKNSGAIVSDTDWTFSYAYESGGNYGCNQGVFSDMIKWETPDGRLINWGTEEYIWYKNQNIQLKKKAITPEYFEVKKMLQTKYGMSSADASKTLSALDSKGACSYAAAANDIMAHWKNKPQEFEEIFGFPLYKKVKNQSVYTFNSEELLADMYICTNTGRFDNRNIFYKDAKGDIGVITDALVRDKYGAAYINNTTDQLYLSGTSGLREDILNRYLQSKSDRVWAKVNNIEKAYLKDGGSIIRNKKSLDKKINNLITTIQSEIKKGNEVSIGIYKSEKTYTKTWLNGVKETTLPPAPISIYCLDDYNVSINQLYPRWNTFTWNEGGRTCYKNYRTDK